MYRERQTGGIPREALRQSRGKQAMLTAYVLLLAAVAAAVFAVACAAVDRFGWKLAESGLSPDGYHQGYPGGAGAAGGPDLLQLGK